MCCMIFLIKLETLELNDEMLGFLELSSFVLTLFLLLLVLYYIFLKIIILKKRATF